MRSFRSITLFWILVCSLATHAADQARSEEKEAVYGVKGASTIAVRITGRGVGKPGLYHIQSGATLRDLIANDKAVWLRSSNGRFRISRYIDGKKITLEKDYHQWDVKLLEGDDIYAESMFDKKQPNPESSVSP